jgi:endogenous inhibitor of DNA gyrase (YacG/DUF329 family)
MSDGPDTPKKATRLKPCPICGALAVEAHRPFCSPRCKQVDLHRWLTGRYAIPVVNEPDEDDPDA